MESQKKLEEIFAKFPGIGPRTARRFVYYILSRSPSFAKELSKLIEEVKKEAHECSLCHRFFVNRQVSSQICNTCSDSNRDHSTLMVVSRDSDFESIEKSGAFGGIYFILGGTVPILDKEPTKRIRLESLLKRISDQKELKEVILSLNTTPDGEHTENIVKEALANILKDSPIKISVLGRGLSTGAEIEYADKETIKNALTSRR